MGPTDFTYVDTPNPHVSRGREILKKYPELKKLMKPYPLSALAILSFVGLQLLIAYLLKDQTWGWVLGIAFLVGALLAHGLFALMHDCVHNLVFKANWANKMIGIVCNVGQGFPSAIAFQHFHLLHHSYMGQYDYDADLSFKAEAKWVGSSTIKKIIWYLFFLLIEAIRPLHIKSKLVNPWVIFNIVIIFAIDGLIYYLWGPKALGYILISCIFGVGLHPVGARWIQEHYIFKEGQETYSYYGPLNITSFNVGYHNEHHDLFKIPWVHLPKIKATAPEFYDNLYAHKSWTKLLLQFLFDPKINLYSRYLRKA